jgi:hypothetical protein
MTATIRAIAVTSAPDRILPSRIFMCVLLFFWLQGWDVAWA